jgi:hypothetical protein
MMKRQDELIDALSSNLEPVKPARNINAMAGAWVLLSALFVIVATYLAGPLRPGVFDQLASNPRFLLETLLGVAAITWVGVAAFRAAIPAALTKVFMLTGLILMGLWLAQYVIGLFNPALEPSTLGVRAACYFETMAYALPPTIVAILLARRLYPLQWLKAASVFGLTAGMIPALYMQLACMYEPTHILAFHILPGLAMVFVGIVGAVIAKPGSEDPEKN